MGKTATVQSQQEIIDSLLYGQSGIKTKHPDLGLVIGVCHQGHTAYYASGTRIRNGKDLLNKTSVFEIGSITKPFTALLLAEAIQDEKVRADDVIDQYIPKEVKLPAAIRNKIKLTDLASHQSGLPNLCEDSFFAELLKKDPRNPFQSVEKSYLYDVLEKTDSLKTYGKYEYNNYAYALLGDILERVRGQTYTSLVEERILRPFNMKYTAFGAPKGSNVAGSYSQQGELQEKLICNAMNPAGGLKSNAVDLMKFLKIHKHTPQSSKAIQLTQQTYYKDENRTVGLGWDIKKDYFQKNGETMGNSTLVRYSVAKQVAIAFLSNYQDEQLVSDAVDFIYNRLSN
jgi:CubicO group peptidase (beta-lactamase class C family)